MMSKCITSLYAAKITFIIEQSLFNIISSKVWPFFNILNHQSNLNIKSSMISGQ